MHLFVVMERPGKVPSLKKVRIQRAVSVLAHQHLWRFGTHSVSVSVRLVNQSMLNI